MEEKVRRKKQRVLHDKDLLVVLLEIEGTSQTVRNLLERQGSEIFPGVHGRYQLCFGLVTTTAVKEPCIDFYTIVL